MYDLKQAIKSASTRYQLFLCNEILLEITEYQIIYLTS